jgi:hypothetical protein
MFAPSIQKIIMLFLFLAIIVNIVESFTAIITLVKSTNDAIIAQLVTVILLMRILKKVQK